MSDGRNGLPPRVLEPGPRTAKQATGWVVLAIVCASATISVTFVMLVYLIASGQI